ncbi:hypothetical protein niasHS_011904 [Heterodera schachtii]|uniref:DUF7083 domain-containing protein n=1 Tax=Heterodera schachtii TaxID=97005 RepID=A0ABD2J4I1_HETSC
MPAQKDPAIDQLVRLLGEQQQIARQQADQIAQLLANNAVAAAPAAVQHQIVQDTIPALPDIIPFECSDEKSRVTEWLERFQFALDCSAPNAKDLTKVKCLMNKLNEGAFSEYSRSVLPSVVTDFGFDDTIKKLQKLFSRPQSIFVDRYECLKAERGNGEDFRHFVNRHRKLLQEFKFDILNKEQFNCLMLLTALKSHSDSALRQRILAKLTADGDTVRYDNIVEDLQVYLSTIAEAKVIEQQPARRMSSQSKSGMSAANRRKNAMISRKIRPIDYVGVAVRPILPNRVRTAVLSAKGARKLDIWRRCARSTRLGSS